MSHPCLFCWFVCLVVEMVMMMTWGSEGDGAGVDEGDVVSYGDIKKRK